MGEVVVEEKPWNRFVKKVSEIFYPEYELESETGYQRWLSDRGIDSYLDRHFKEYLTSFGLVTEIDMERLERRYGVLENQVKELKDFALDSDAKTSNLERRVQKLKETVK